MTELRHIFNFRDNCWHKTCTQRGVSEAVSVKINFDPRKKKKLTPQNVLETLAEDSCVPTLLQGDEINSLPPEWTK